MKRTFLIAAMALSMGAMQAVPAYRQLVRRVQPDGTELMVRLQGDERQHLLFTADNIALMEDAEGYLRYARIEEGQLTCQGAPVAHNAQQRTAAEQAYIAGQAPVSLAMLCQANAPKRAPQDFGNEVIQIGDFPTQGNVRALFILAEFSDVKFSFDADFFDRIMNEEGNADLNQMGSARDYFIAQSGGIFQPTFDVVGPISLNHTQKFYGENDFWGGDKQAELLIRDAAQAAHDRYDVDFSQYDYDNDGKVDMVYVLYAGRGENYGASSDCIWPHKYELSSCGINLVLDGKQVDTYACSCELYGTEGNDPTGIGTFCHEFSHVMGLADHYSTIEQTNMMLGRYDLMDYGCYNDSTYTPCNYTAFERYSVQWMDLDEIHTPGTDYELSDIASSYHAYKLQTPNPDEYFVLEARRQQGWDEFIPGKGMMITHVNYNRSIWAQNKVNDGENPGYCIVPADNKRSYNDEAKDLYPQPGFGILPGVNSFTDGTKPSQQTYDGQNTNRWVTNIKLHADSLVTFDFMVNSIGIPEALPVSHVWRHGFTAEWTPSYNAERYSIDLYRYDTLSTRPVLAAEDFERFTAGSYASPDVTELGAKLDEYMNQPGWTGDRICQAGGMARLGAANVSGTLTSPAFDFTKSNGCFTVVVKAQGFTGKSPVLTVSANGYEAKHRLSATQKEYLYLFAGGTDMTQVTFTTNKERVYLDDLYIKRGDATAEHPDANIIEVTAPQGAQPVIPGGDEMGDIAFERVFVQTIEDIKDCWYAFTDLPTDMRYCFLVRAWKGEGSSEPSAEVEVELLGTMGIEAVLADENKNGRCTVYDLEGHRLASDRVQKGRLYVTTDGRKFIVR